MRAGGSTKNGIRVNAPAKGRADRNIIDVQIRSIGLSRSGMTAAPRITGTFEEKEMRTGVHRLRVSSASGGKSVEIEVVISKDRVTRKTVVLK